MAAVRTSLSRILAFLALLLVLKVAVGVVVDYRNYIPPNFESEFLRGREAYFFGAYRWAFYVHVITGPATLVLGMILLSERFRRWAPLWHRRLGRVQGICILLLLVPSGLWMSFYAETGAAAGSGLAALAVATAVCVTLGWRAAVRRNFLVHRLWMMRTFLLLCSAVVIRVIGGLATVANYDAPWLYPASIWASWLAPLLIFESIRLLNAPIDRQSSRHAPRAAARMPLR
jgi:hypothetical protein